ncbi:filamentous hemagglutinin [Pararobbsia alpina]|uniref:two-partner secretion domain-containing protein n=1 Tax=Pararobbsia alpina TaxID=621374 RepID=UPI0039A6487C
MNKTNRVRVLSEWMGVAMDCVGRARRKTQPPSITAGADTARHRASFARANVLNGFLLRRVALAVVCVLGMRPARLDAQIVAAPGAGSKPFVGATANGLPIVQIATPNGAGVSNNGFVQYNVGSKGLILNNSLGTVQTQLGGYVTGNRNLVSGSARVIVNQVAGGVPSQLLGYTEVAGQKAEIVIANPAGIVCNGCGFINTNPGILTTGTPIYGGTGSLDAFHVTGGQIQIGASGLNGNNVDEVDLIARSVAINGKVCANQSLNVVTGNNDVRHDDLSAQSLGPDGNAPSVAIDVAQLGGMYAGKIRLVGTEAGVGVNSAGTIEAQSGDLQLTSQGKISLSGSTTASGNVSISGAGDVANSGAIYATQTTSLSSQGQVSNSGIVAALGNTMITGASVRSSGALGAGVDHTGEVAADASLAVDAAGAVSNDQGQMSAAWLSVTADSVSNRGGTLSHTGREDLLVALKGVFDNTGGTVTSHARNTTLRTSSLTNVNGTISTDSLSLTASLIDNRSGQITASHGLSVAANTLQGGGLLSAAGDLTLSLQGNFSVESNYSFKSGHLLAFKLPGSFSNAGVLAAVNDLTIHAGDIANSGSLGAGGQLTTQSNSLTNTGAIVGNSVSLHTAQTLANLGTRALIGATDSTGKLELLASRIENRDDTTAIDAPAMTTIYGLGHVMLAGGKDANGNYVNANRVHNQSGVIQSGRDMLIAANQVINTRRLMATGGFTSNVDPRVLTSQGISLSGRTGQVNFRNPASIGGVYVDPPHNGQWNSDYQFTTYTGVAIASTVTSISPESRIVAGTNLNAARVGTFQNYWSQVAAAGNIASPAILDQNSWQRQTALQVKVTYSGQYHYNNYDNSEHDWQLPFGNARFVGKRPRGYSQVAPADVRTYALPAYESSFTAGKTLSGTGVSIHNIAGNASITPLGVHPGQVVGVGAGTTTGHEQSDGAGNPIVARATAGNLLSNLTLPAGGLFHVNRAPGAAYLVETHPAFTNRQQWLSSDYYFSQMSVNPGQIQMRLGDGFYEQHLLENQILAMTGKSVLTNYADTQGEYEALMTNGAAFAKAVDLAPGTSLSPEQVARLTSNVVIMQEQIVDGQAVLVPVVYLAQASQQNMGNGPVIAATNIDLHNAQTVINGGTISASNNVSIDGQSIDSSFGTLVAGNAMALATANDVNLTSATVNAGSLSLQAGGNLILDTTTRTVSQVSATGATRASTTLGRAASINVTDDAAIVTGGNFEQNAGTLNVGGALGMNIGGNWNLGVQRTGEKKFVARANGVSDTHIVGSTGSSVNVGGASSIAVGGDLTAVGASIHLVGGGTVAADGNVSLLADTSTSTVHSTSSGDDNRRSYSENIDTSDDAVRATALRSGQSLNVVAGKDITVTGSTLNLTQGNATLVAAGNVNIVAADETHVSGISEQHEHSGVLSSSNATHRVDQTTTTTRSSTISADGVTVVSGRDIDVTGSHIVATNDVALGGKGHVNVLAATDIYRDSERHDVKHSGFSGTGGLGITYGSTEQKNQYSVNSATQSASRSAIGSVQGDVSIAADQDVHIGGSDIVAGRDLELVGQNLDLHPGSDATQASMRHRTSQFGVTLALGGVAGSAASTVVQRVQRADEPKDSRLVALESVQAGLGVYGAEQAVERYVANRAAPGDQPLVSVTASVGGGSSHSEAQSRSVASNGSTLNAGHTVTLVATGSGANDASGYAIDGDINAIGTQIATTNVALNAARDINLHSARDASQQTSNNSSSNASIGVGFGLGGQQNGFTIELAASGGKGNANGSSLVNRGTTVSASDKLMITSGRDTNIRGAEASGNTLDVNVGRDLSIVSLQDTNTYNSKQTSAGFQASLCVPPICVGTTVTGSANASQQSIKQSFRSVSQQSGLYAGDGGFTVNVGNHTQLDGGVIASTAGADANSLSTQTLGYSNLQNSADYSGSTIGFSASGAAGVTSSDSVSFASPVTQAGSSGPGPTHSQGLGPSGFGAAVVSDSTSGTTHAAISAGTITVRSDAVPGQDSVAGLSRDTSNANGSVQNTFNAQAIENDMAVQQQTTQVGMQVVGEVATHLEDKANRAALAAAAALTDAQASGDSDAMTQAWASVDAAEHDADLWRNGGVGRIGLHTVVAGVGAATGGGNVVGASGGAFVGSIAGSYVADKLTDTPGGTLLSNLASGATGAVGGSVLGGAAGAFGGAGASLSADLYNRQLHQSEKEKIRQLARQYIDQHGSWLLVSDPDRLANVMSKMALAQVDSGYMAYLVKSDPYVVVFAHSTGLWEFMTSHTQGATFFDGTGNHAYFTATPAERSDSQLYLAPASTWTPADITQYGRVFGAPPPIDPSALGKTPAGAALANAQINAGYSFYTTVSNILGAVGGERGAFAPSSARSRSAQPGTSTGGKDKAQHPHPDSVAAKENNFYRDGSNLPEWTAGKPRDMAMNAAEHWAKHGAEFPEIRSLNEYVVAASSFAKNPPSGTLTYKRKNGDTVLYDPKQNTYLVRRADGLPKTMFRPVDGIEYWNQTRSK